jgi:hypothetical protein
MTAPSTMDERRDIREELSAYLDGELRAAPAQRVAVAARTEAALAEELAGLRATRNLLRCLPPVRLDAGFAARVLAEAQRRGLVPTRRARTGLWVGRAAAAAVLLLAACVGGIVLSTVSGRRPEAPFADGAGGPVVLARAERGLEEGDLAGRRGRTSGLAGGTPTGPGSPGRPASVLDAASATPKCGKGVAPAPGPGIGSPAGRSKHDVSLASLKSKLAERFGHVAGTGQHGLVQEVDLPVRDLVAARQQVVAVLARADVPPLGVLEAHSEARVRATAGRPALTDRLRFYHEGPADPRSFLYVVVDTNESVAQVSQAVRELRASWQEAAPSKRLCLAGDALHRSTAPALPRTPAPARPPTTQQQQPYHVAQIRRLPDEKDPSTAPAAGPSTASARPGPALLIITVHLRPEAPTTTSQAVLNVKQ